MDKESRQSGDGGMAGGATDTKNSSSSSYGVMGFIEVVIRVLALGGTLAAAIVMGRNKQTILVFGSAFQAKTSYSPALVWNLTASAARPNPQGSYHYGNITITRTIKLANSANFINGKQRYAVNGVSFLRPDTPLKLADYYNIGGVFTLGGIPNNPDGRSPYLQTAVISGEYRAFIEIVFQNYENTIQSWHLDGYSFFVAGMDGGEWTPASRKVYNLFDTVSRCTTQVYPKSWTAILLSLDNAGMWNLRSETWERQYLGQQTYLRVKSPVNSLRDEYDIPHNALLCGKANGRPRTPRP